MAHVAEVAAWVEKNPDRLVLLGAQPTSPEVEYGWIEPGEGLGELSSGPVRAVRQFWEKPAVARARACMTAGHLWNTSIIVGKVATLVQTGCQALPELSDRLARIEPFVGTPEEPDAVRQAFELMPKVNFSRAVLEACPEALSVSRLPRIVWSDLGSPHRVMEALTRMRIRPEWARSLAPPELDGGPGRRGGRPSGRGSRARDGTQRWGRRQRHLKVAIFPQQVRALFPDLGQHGGCPLAEPQESGRL
jgi:hypothetical protein